MADVSARNACERACSHSGCCTLTLTLTKPTGVVHRGYLALCASKMKLPSVRRSRKQRPSETAPLLVQHKELDPIDAPIAPALQVQVRRTLSWKAFLFRFIVYWSFFGVVAWNFDSWARKASDKLTALPSDPHKAAKRILDYAPVIVSSDLLCESQLLKIL